MLQVAATKLFQQVIDEISIGVASYQMIKGIALQYAIIKTLPSLRKRVERSQLISRGVTQGDQRHRQIFYLLIFHEALKVCMLLSTSTKRRGIGGENTNFTNEHP